MTSNNRNSNQNENRNNNTGSMSVQEAGRMGGEARAEKYSHEELSEQARRAAQTVEEEHPGFHAEIGRKGGEARGNNNENQNQSNNRR